MEQLFLKLFNMSINAGWIVLAVMIFRFLFKKTPKWINVCMWGIVGLRLVLPFSLESIFSLIPSAETVPEDIMYSPAPTVQTGIPVINSAVNPVISESLAPNIGDSANPMQIVLFIASVIWIVGICAMGIYSVISYLSVRRKVCEAVALRNGVMLCDNVSTPFILGIIKPKIYLPSSISEDDAKYVIAHENAHLKRGDHLIKPMGFLLLSIYWFNPILWVAYIFLCRDIEFACDEKVIKDMGEEIKKPYSEVLVNCSIKRRMIAACPLAFGETGVKTRIKSILKYKKPAVVIIAISLVVAAIFAVCFLTNPKDKPDNEDISEIGGVDAPSNVVTTKNLTLDELISLSEKGEDLLWEDFEGYTHFDVGSGLHVEHFPIDDMFYLLIGGSYNIESDTMEAMYLKLCANDGTEANIDVRYGDVEKFINDHKDNPVEHCLSASWHLCPVGPSESAYSELTKHYGIPRGAALNHILSLNTVKITSVSEFEKFAEIMKDHMDFSLSYPDKDAFTTPSFDSIKGEYTSGFFKENTLFIVYISSGAPERYSVDKVTLTEGKLSVCIAETLYASTDTKQEGWLMCIPLSNDDVSDITDYGAYITKRIDHDSTLEVMPVSCYVYTASEEVVKPGFHLYREGTFQATFSALDSSVYDGTYSVTDDKLILATHDGSSIFTFKINGDNVIFDKEHSSDIIFDSVPDGAVFELALPKEPEIKNEETTEAETEKAEEETTADTEKAETEPADTVAQIEQTITIDIFDGSKAPEKEKKTIVSIVDSSELSTSTLYKLISPECEVFLEKNGYKFYFESNRSDNITVTYSDGTTQKLKDALKDENVTVYDMHNNGIRFYSDPPIVIDIHDHYYDYDPPGIPGTVYTCLVTTFYEDETYKYQFHVGKTSNCQVYYLGRSHECIVRPLEEGIITISDLDRFGIIYGKEPRRNYP